ncbi:sugar transferase [Clostridium luticellarii]|jgi:exopolysaccharide biosynthesis polyprenyl glycosylphosphotransferase|uniref:Putative sugar transferase EpsL n=1 Tax=Clostridium luticellarii TaxID=1691940 RepID=A0A2T0BR17_9CLOT|nr:sugar transferase [Clostridium luticellarii]MCI1944317.1 sugar transferase [Clostridium luticellarii]MCI1967813.1 sugar transferase [Clostridium luticellarii]MCI1994691.1 sugar transferase [Clostridium luticellarii]MCI2038812.1 sugar transferase [Clostridium luticellarii]PRR86295.1 putative sugar transferase EpsL [Clostridium luticellarii]
MQADEIKIDMEMDIKSKALQFFVKRVFDILFSAVGMVLLSVVFVILILWIKLDSKGPAIFKQIRVGKNGKNFTIYKFRTMVVDAEKKHKLNIDPGNLENFVFQSRNDNRVTKSGAFLRKTSLDEIPQLFNVLLGNMSLVGPRPEIPEVVKLYPEAYRQRLMVTPGITGLAQVSGRGEIELGKTVYYDLTYIKKFSLLTDIKILFKTIFSVFKSEGAF